MSKSAHRKLTQILEESRDGDPGQLADRVFEVVHSELRQLAGGLLRRERANVSLEPAVLVNETYLRLVGDSHADWKSRTHFFGVAARAMRQILVEHARRRATAKRGGGWQRITLNEDVHLPGGSEVEILGLESALARLAEKDPRMAQIVELRVFTGLTVEEVAQVLGISSRTVQGDWRVAKMILARELSAGRSRE